MRVVIAGVGLRQQRSDVGNVRLAPPVVFRRKLPHSGQSLVPPRSGALPPQSRHASGVALPASSSRQSRVRICSRTWRSPLIGQAIRIEPTVWPRRYSLPRSPSMYPARGDSLPGKKDCRIYSQRLSLLADAAPQRIQLLRWIDCTARRRHPPHAVTLFDVSGSPPNAPYNKEAGFGSTVRDAPANENPTATDKLPDRRE